MIVIRYVATLHRRRASWIRYRAPKGIEVNTRALIVFLWTCLIGSAAMAGEEYRTKIEIAVDDEATGQQTFRFDSADSGFDLHDLAVGETRTLTGESGNTAMVTRTEDGWVMDVDGRKIDLGDLHDLGGAHGEHEVEKSVRMIRTDDADAVTIISDKAIDEATRNRIREALQSSGQDREVLFIDGTDLEASGAHQAHKRREVRIIKKKEDATD